MRQLRTGLVAGFNNRCSGRHRMRRCCPSRVGGRSKNDGHPMQTGGKDRICLAIAAREPVWLGEQKVDADNSRRCRDIHQPGELIARPGPLADMAD